MNDFDSRSDSANKDAATSETSDIGRVLGELRSNRPTMSTSEYLSFANQLAKSLDDHEFQECFCIDLLERLNEGSPISIEDYINSSPRLNQNDDVLELIDAEICWKFENQPDSAPENYIERFPEHAIKIRSMFALCEIELKWNRLQIANDELPNRMGEWRPIAQMKQVDWYVANHEPNPEMSSHVVLAGNHKIELDRQYSLQVLGVGDDCEITSEGKHELELAGRLTELAQKNFVSILEIGRSNHHLYLLVQQVQGTRLTDRIASGVTGSDAGRWLQKIVFALLAARELGIHNVNPTPDRIWIDHEGEIKLLVCDLHEWMNQDRRLELLGVNGESWQQVEWCGQLIENIVDGRSDAECQTLSAIASRCFKASKLAIKSIDELADELVSCQVSMMKSK